jgi:hypothetical protein
VEWLDDAFCGNKTSGEKDKADWGQSEVMKKGDEGRRNFALAKRSQTQGTTKKQKQK